MAKLQEALLDMPTTGDDELRGIIRKISKWKWEMSAAGFFTVDRSVVGRVSFRLLALLSIYLNSF